MSCPTLISLFGLFADTAFIQLAIASGCCLRRNGIRHSKNSIGSHAARMPTFVMITQAYWVVGVVLLMTTLNKTFRRTRSLRRAKCNETRTAATVANAANTVPTAAAAAMLDFVRLREGGEFQGSCRPYFVTTCLLS